MYALLLALVIFFVALIASFRARDQVIASCAAIIWIGGTIVFVAQWVTGYRWANQTGCREAFYEYFGGRAPRLETNPFPVRDDMSWWPLGRRCSGPASDTGQFVSVDPGWGLSLIVYPILTAVVGSVLVIAVRLAAARSRNA